MGEMRTGPYRDGEYDDEHRDGLRDDLSDGLRGDIQDELREHGDGLRDGLRSPHAGHGRHSRPAPGDQPSHRELGDAEAERLLDGPWALHVRALGTHLGTVAGITFGTAEETGNDHGDHAPRPTDLPDLGISAVAGRPARVAYSAGWDGADDPSGHAGARGTAGYRGAQGGPHPAAAGGALRSDQSAGSADSGGEMTVSSVDFPVDLASPDVQAVARLLAAATAPARPHELRGYETARRAFEHAGTTPARRGAVLPLRRLIGVKVAAVAGALTVTGVAVAAEADVLPSPIQRVAHQMLGGVGVPDPEPGTTAASPPGGAMNSSGRPGTPQPTGSAASGSSAGGGIPAPGTSGGTKTAGASGTSGSSDGNVDVLTLCRVFVAQQSGGSPLSGHDRRSLAILAGSEDKIADFCAHTLAAAPPESSVPSAQPSGTQASSSAPSPSKDHKPTDTSPPSAAPTTPPSTGADGHSHTPNPSHTPHLNKS